MADGETEQLRAEVAELRETVQTLTQALSTYMSSKGDDGAGEDGGDDGEEGLSWQEVVPTIGGGEGGSHMGNTTDSVEIDGDATFASASDSNVEVKTSKETSGNDEVNKITIGVYWK